jgi:pentatricopeptide repeat protein
VRSFIFTLLPLVAILAALFGAYQSYKKQQRVLHIALFSFLLIVLGYSTYTSVYVRAGSQPPMNENDPSDLARLVSYLNREQYGSAPLLQRRWSTEPDHQERFNSYSSDFDYLWRYQMNHMFLRYLGWNYIGSEGDWKEAGVSWKQLYGIPFFLGILGAYYHWKRDKKMAFVASTFFFIMSVILVLYFNMQEPQPRERDYFYVGAFFVFSMWVGMGVLALIDTVKEKLGDSQNRFYATYGILAAALLFVPANMARTNFRQADRTGNMVAYDYSYNTLQSCEPNAILFTNGDNDTFPLWYLQDVEGIRQDVRIVNLSLVNTNWYIKQLKNEEPYGAQKVPISLADANIETIQPLIPFEPREYRLPVPKELLALYDVKDTAITNHQSLPFFLNSTLQYGNYKGIRVQDIMVFDIIKTNNWQRPIYFAMTVSDDGKIGLQSYLQWDGMAFKFVPKKTESSSWTNMNAGHMQAHLFTDIKEPSKTPQLGFLWRNLGNKSVYYDEDARRMMVNYRQTFLAYCGYYLNVANKSDMVIKTLQRMEELIPSAVIPMPLRFKLVVANYFDFAGDKAGFRRVCQEIIDEVKPILERGTTEELSMDHPYMVLLQTYAVMGMFDDALQLLDKMKQQYPLVPGIDEFVTERKKEIEGRRMVSAAQKKDSLASSSPKSANTNPTKAKGKK